MYKPVPWTQSVTFVSNLLHRLLNKAHVSQAVMIIQSARLFHVVERNLEIIPKLRQCIRVVIRYSDVLVFLCLSSHPNCTFHLNELTNILSANCFLVLKRGQIRMNIDYIYCSVSRVLWIGTSLCQSSVALVNVRMSA